MNSPALQVAIALAQASALLMSVAFISYALVIVVPYLRYKPSRAGDALTLDWHLFVPALNEERVIGDTIDYLRATFPRAHVWVIDDDPALTLATSVCNAANLTPVPVLPGKSLEFSLGGLTVLLVSGASYQMSRRRKAA